MGDLGKIMGDFWVFPPRLFVLLHQKLRSKANGSNSIKNTIETNLNSIL